MAATRNSFAQSFRNPALPEENLSEARWALGLLVRIRFAHIALETALLVPALRLGWMFPSDLPWTLGALAALAAFNLISLLWHRRGHGVSPAFLLLQIAADLTAMTVIFGVSGGLTNPIHSLIHFQIGLAGILLPTGMALPALAMGCAVLAALGWSTQSLADPYAWMGPLGPNLAYEWLLACAVAGLSIFAARRSRHYRDRLREAQDRGRQQDRLRATGAVASGFCHELASPLNAAGLLADRLRRKAIERAAGAAPPDPVANLAGELNEWEEWDELRDSLDRCDRIVRTMAGAPWDPEELSLQTTDAATLLEKIVREWNGRVPVRLEAWPAPRKTGQGEDGFRVAAPPVGLGQTLINLLRNAEEASPQGTGSTAGAGSAEGPGSPGIDVRMKSRGDSVAITVSDRGAGVDPAIRRALGTPFNSRKGAGRGLGLFAALHFTESLGGTLEFVPRPGGGTEAILTLPRARTVPAEGAA